MRKIILCPYLIILITSCNNHDHVSGYQSKIEEIDISNSYNSDRKVLLSDIVSNISYVKLQTDSNCLISNIREPEKNILFDRSLIFISDRKNLFLFDSTGKFIRSIGKIGRGPGEIASFDDFALLSSDSLVVVFSHQNRTVFVYSYNGKFIKNIKVDFLPTSLSTLSKEFIVFGSAKGRRNLTDYYTLSVLDLQGNLRSHLINSQWEKEVEKKDEIGLGTICQFYNIYDTLSYWEFQYDTIWRICNQNRAIPKYYINSGPKKMPFSLLLTSSKNAEKDRDRYVKIWKITETNRYLFLRVGYEIYLKYILYDKLNKSSFNLKYSVGQNDEIGFFNNIDSGLPFWPLGIVTKNKIFTLNYPDDLRKKFTINNTVLLTEKQKSLYKIIQNSDKSDNPILMIVTLKDQ